MTQNSTLMTMNVLPLRRLAMNIDLETNGREFQATRAKRAIFFCLVLATVAFCTSLIILLDSAVLSDHNGFEETGKSNQSQDEARGRGALKTFWSLALTLFIILSCFTAVTCIHRYLIPKYHGEEIQMGMQRLQAVMEKFRAICEATQASKDDRKASENIASNSDNPALLDDSEELKRKQNFLSYYSPFLIVDSDCKTDSRRDTVEGRGQDLGIFNSEQNERSKTTTEH